MLSDSETSTSQTRNGNLIKSLLSKAVSSTVNTIGALYQSSKEVISNISTNWFAGESVSSDSSARFSFNQELPDGDHWEISSRSTVETLPHDNMPPVTDVPDNLLVPALLSRVVSNPELIESYVGNDPHRRGEINALAFSILHPSNNEPVQSPAPSPQIGMLERPLLTRGHSYSF